MRIARAPLLAALLTLAATAVLPGVAALAADDPYRPAQWGLERIGAPDAWSASRGRGQVIAIIDTGVDPTHPDLVDRFLRDGQGRVVGRDLIEDDAVAQDENGHGTMVAGIAAAAADNGVGIAGTAPQARIMPVRVLDEQGRGSAADVDQGIRWAVDNGATVINLSLESVAPLPGAIVSQAPDEAVRYAWEAGVPVVAAAGNSGAPFTDYPSSSPVLLVGATDRDDARTGFSDTGRRDAVLAPGVEIVSTWCDPTPQGCDPANRYGQADGTSFAAPFAAGALAVLRGAGLAPAAAVQRLRETAEDLGPEGPDTTNGYGRIDLARAVGTVGTASSPSSPPSPRPTPSPTPRQPTPSPTPAPPATGGPAPTAPTTTPPAPSATTAPPPPEEGTSPAPADTESAVPQPAPPGDPGQDVTPLGTVPPLAGADGGATEPPPRDLVVALAVVLLGVSVSALATFGRGPDHRR